MKQVAGKRPIPDDLLVRQFPNHFFELALKRAQRTVIVGDPNPRELDPALIKRAVVHSDPPRHLTAEEIAQAEQRVLGTTWKAPR